MSLFPNTACTSCAQVQITQIYENIFFYDYLVAASCSRRLHVPLSSLTPITPPLPRRGASTPPQPSSIPRRDLSTSLDDCPEERQFVYAGIQSQLAEPLLLGATSETQQLTVNKQAVSHVRIRLDSCFDRHARQWVFYKPSAFFLSIPCSPCETVSAAGGLQNNSAGNGTGQSRQPVSIWDDVSIQYKNTQTLF